MSPNYDIFEDLPDDSIAISKQVLVCFCLDTSYSMTFNNKIKELNKCVKEFIRRQAIDPFNSDSLNICIITYGGEKATVIQEFTNVKEIRYDDIVPSGATAMGDGVKLAIKTILEERNRYKQMGAQMYKPILFIMSDGKSTDDVEMAVEIENKAIREGKVSVTCVGIGIDDDEDAKKELRRFSPNKDLIMINDVDMDEIFWNLSRSITGVSTQFTGGFKDDFNN